MTYKDNKLYLIGKLTNFPNLADCYLCAVKLHSYSPSIQSYVVHSPHEKLKLSLFSYMQLRSMSELGMLANRGSFDTKKKMQYLPVYDYYDHNSNADGIIAFIWGLELEEKPKSNTRQGYLSSIHSNINTCYVAFYHVVTGEWEFFNTDVEGLYELIFEERIEFANIKTLKSGVSKKRGKTNFYYLTADDIGAKFPNKYLGIQSKSFILCYLPHFFTEDTVIEVLSFN